MICRPGWKDKVGGLFLWLFQSQESACRRYQDRDQSTQNGLTRNKSQCHRKLLLLDLCYLLRFKMLLVKNVLRFLPSVIFGSSASFSCWKVIRSHWKQTCRPSSITSPHITQRSSEKYAMLIECLCDTYFSASKIPLR